MSTSLIHVWMRRERIGHHYHTTVDKVEWDNPLGHVDADLLDDLPSLGNLYEIGPYIAKLVCFDKVFGYAILVKVDHPLLPLLEASLPLRRAWQWLTPRLVYTLAIWGLAKYPDEGCYIGWYLVKERWLE